MRASRSVHDILAVVCLIVLLPWRRECERDKTECVRLRRLRLSLVGLEGLCVIS
jgi:hypothetical protein